MNTTNFAKPFQAKERQLTSGPGAKDLDNNANFSPDGKKLVFDMRGSDGIKGNSRLGIAEIATGTTHVFYQQSPNDIGVGAANYFNASEVIAIHSIPGIPYDFTLRGGMIISVDGSGKHRWLDSRKVTLPFVPGALRGGTHKHDPDSSGKWVGFTYNDHIMKFEHRSDIRNVGVTRTDKSVQPFSADAGKGEFHGDGFSVLLTSAVDDPKPGSDEYLRADGDCWVGSHGYPTANGYQLARAFRGTVRPSDGGNETCMDVFVVDVPHDITIPGADGPLEGTALSYPKPPKGATVRRLTFTANDPDIRLRGIGGHLRSSPDGKWIAFVGKSLHDGVVEDQIFVVSTRYKSIRQVSHIPGGVVNSPVECARFASNDKIAVLGKDGAIWAVSVLPASFGNALRLTPAHNSVASNLVVSLDGKTAAYNRIIDGIKQIFVCNIPASSQISSGK